MLALVLGTLAFLEAGAIVVLGFSFVSSKIKLARFAKLDDAEQHLARITEQATELRLNAESYAKEIAKSKAVYAKYTEVIGVCKSAAEAQQKLDSIKLDLAMHAEALKGARTVTEINTRVNELTQQLEQLTQQLDIAGDELAMQEIGIYRRVYDFDHPEQYKAAIDKVIADQKAMVKAKTALHCRANWVVEGSEVKGRKMADEQMRLMLRAFNGEADSAISKIKHSNFASLAKRIRASFATLDKLGATKQIDFNPQYLELKLRELRLSHEWEISKQEEKERQREIKEQIQEEARAEREIEEARRKAEAEESVKEQALAAARKQLADEHGQHNEKLALLIAKLELELSEAIDRKAKAIARAQLTKSGYVYVLSNIGTMGKNRYKIGMTRRIEPLVRVAELGDASVPFPFDVHAMIFCEDAPALEFALHQRFSSRRANLVNLRKEYFDVTLDEIREAVAKEHGLVTFLLEPPADQYRETLAIKADQEPIVTAVAVA